MDLNQLCSINNEGSQWWDLDTNPSTKVSTYTLSCLQHMQPWNNGGTELAEIVNHGDLKFCWV